MINIREFFFRLANRRWDVVSAAASQDRVKELNRDTKPKRTHKPTAQRPSVTKPETKQSRKQVAYHKRKAFNHHDRRRSGHKN